MSRHWFASPLRQKPQAPQGRKGETATRSPGGKAGHALPKRYHMGRDLMPEDHRRIDHEGADPAMGVVMHIRPADADRVQLDAHIAGAKHGLVPVDLREIAQRKLVFTFKNKGFHRLILSWLSRQPRVTMRQASASAMALEIQIVSPAGSMKRNQNSDSATQITTEMKIRSNQLVSIGRKIACG